MSKDNPTVIKATPLAYPRASKALSNVVLALPAEKRPDFYHVLSEMKDNATVGDLPTTLQSAVIAHWE
jgi:hypothetical protein